MKKLLMTFISCILMVVCLFGITACNDTPEEKDERPVMVVLGDSWSAGIGASWCHVGEDDAQQHSGAYGTICGEITGYKVYNHAVGGYKVESVLTQLKANNSNNSVAEHIKSASVIYIGVIGNNVVLHEKSNQILSDAALGKFTILDQMIGTLRMDWAEMIETIQGLNQEAEIIVHNVVSMGLERDDVQENEVEGGNKAYIRLHNQVVKYYLNSHPGAYHIATLAAKINETDESNNDGHPNDPYHVRLAVSLYEKFKEWGIPVAEENVVLSNLKNYTVYMFEGFNKNMVKLKSEFPSYMPNDIAVDIEAYKALIEDHTTFSAVVKSFYDTYAEKDPRPYGTPEWVK